MTVAIVNYGMGNVNSVEKAISSLGYSSILTNDFEQLNEADVILLPGVGSFEKGMNNLNELGLVEVLTKLVVEKNKPFIGICLGMQLLASFGTEPTRNKGLGWIEGEVLKIETSNSFRVPHMGWNAVKSHQNSELFVSADKGDFYFIHSYHFVPKNKNDIVLTVDYNETMVAAVQHKNIVAMQFHPEKSQKLGLALLNNILSSFVKN